nr:PREDICTED: uncharacterized protein LOC108194972 [Daucus carota subsp. sativus]
MEDILPGPLSQEVILDNSYHVSAAVWAGVDRGPLECFCGNRSMRSWFLSDAQKEILHAIGFGVFANPRLILQTDARLVSALVERWRPETNTFFMRQGEMTVTLEDVGYILGLPIHGRPLVGDVIDNQKDFFRRNWFEELSTADVDSAHTRGGVRYTWLFETYGADPGPDPERILIHTQAYLFVVVGAVLFPTTSRNVVHPRYLRHLRRLREIPTWSWEGCQEDIRLCVVVGAWIDDRIIYGYMWLLREREEAIAAAGVYPRKPIYYFMDPFFITLAMELDYTVLTERVKRFFVTWGSCGIGPPINEVDYIFVPANVNGNHWILMVLSVKEWGVMVFDPMTNKAEHAKEEQCVVGLLARMLRYLGPRLTVPKEDPLVQVWDAMPKQNNYTDCGVYICKYMDYLLQGYDLSTLVWDASDLEVFRYRIAKELQKGKARSIPNHRMSQRVSQLA